MPTIITVHMINANAHSIARMVEPQGRPLISHT
jgi:hypothetical protein